MKQCNKELFELRIKKVIDTMDIVYKTLASYNEMAFPLKKLKKETIDYLFCFILQSHINRKTLTIDNLKYFNEVFKKNSVFKDLKLKKVKDIAEIDYREVYRYTDNILKTLPLFIKTSAYFDTFVRANLKEKVASSDVIYKCLYAMLAYSHDIDENDPLAEQFKIELNVVKDHYKKQKINL